MIGLFPQRPLCRQSLFAGEPVRTLSTSAVLAAGAILALLAGPASAADPATIDWSKIAPKTVTLFYPGQSTYDWLLSAEHKKGDKQVPQGKECVNCHEGDEADIGNKLVYNLSLVSEKACRYDRVGTGKVDCALNP